MDVSVVICTRNRAASLGRALNSISALEIPEETKWEVVVVNNASTDNTAAVINSFRDTLPIRSEYEPRAGVANARNCGTSAAKGRYIIWTDDDVLVDRQWLAAYVAAFRRWPDAALFGGRIFPLLEEPVPAWLVECWDYLAGAFAYRDFGDEPLPLRIAEPRILPFTANAAVRSEEQRGYPFNPLLGPAPGNVILGEEVDMMERMLNDGKIGYWVPEAKVQHCIPQDRQTTQYIFAFYTALGRFYALRDQTRSVRRILGAPRWLWICAALDGFRYAIHRNLSRPSIWIPCYAEYAQHRGALEYWRLQSSKSG